MTEINQIWKCNICGNIIEIVHKGADALVCCGQPMILQAENTVDAAKEKHVPVEEPTEQGIKVKVGSVEHPMQEDHYIEWIEINMLDEGRVAKKFLKPGDKPEVDFKTRGNHFEIRAYCNLHGLWKSE